MYPLGTAIPEQTAAVYIYRGAVLSGRVMGGHEMYDPTVIVILFGYICNTKRSFVDSTGKKKITAVGFYI